MGGECSTHAWGQHVVQGPRHRIALPGWHEALGHGCPELQGGRAGKKWKCCISSTLIPNWFNQVNFLSFYWYLNLPWFLQAIQYALGCVCVFLGVCVCLLLLIYKFIYFCLPRDCPKCPKTTALPTGGPVLCIQPSVLLANRSHVAHAWALSILAGHTYLRPAGHS